jgi:formylglycine-generating enzyme required for sulfatase activity
MKTGLNHAVRLTVAALSIVLGLGAAVPAAAQCPGDVVATGGIDGTDLAAVLGAWGTNGQGPLVTDLNSDGIVNGADLAVILGGWGPCITVPSWATPLEWQPDPAVVWDPALRQAIIATGLPWRVRDTATHIEMVLIPPGTFNMGGDGSDGPVHQVTLTNAFYLGRYEVTHVQWKARMGSDPSAFQGPSIDVPAHQVPNRPVEQVSWNHIAGAGGFMAQTGMRLPTEAEWEYAYRAGTTTAFHGFKGYPNGTNDESLVGSIGWWGASVGGNSGGYTHPVGQKLGNGFGLHDMAGNVWEWVNDWYSSNYYASSPSHDPPGPASGTCRVVRGGSWFNGAVALRADWRGDSAPSYLNYGIGFRAARSP